MEKYRNEKENDYHPEFMEGSRSRVLRATPIKVKKMIRLEEEGMENLDFDDDEVDNVGEVKERMKVVRSIEVKLIRNV